MSLKNDISENVDASGYTAGEDICKDAQMMQKSCGKPCLLVLLADA